MKKNQSVIDIFIKDPKRYDLMVSREDYQNNLIPAINSIIDLKNKDIIEFGAGTGRLTFKLSNYAREILAIEYLPSLLKIALQKQKNNGTIIIIETLGIFEEEPPESFLKTYSYLENELGFNRKQIKTDYEFTSKDEAIDLLSF